MGLDEKAKQFPFYSFATGAFLYGEKPCMHNLNNLLFTKLQDMFCEELGANSYFVNKTVG